MSTKSVNLNIRTNKELKESVGKILDDLGLDHRVPEWVSVSPAQLQLAGLTETYLY